MLGLADWRRCYPQRVTTWRCNVPSAARNNKPRRSGCRRGCGATGPWDRRFAACTWRISGSTARARSGDSSAARVRSWPLHDRAADANARAARDARTQVPDHDPVRQRTPPTADVEGAGFRTVRRLERVGQQPPGPGPPGHRSFGVLAPPNAPLRANALLPCRYSSQGAQQHHYCEHGQRERRQRGDRGPTFETVIDAVAALPTPPSADVTVLVVLV